MSSYTHRLEQPAAIAQAVGCTYSISPQISRIRSRLSLCTPRAFLQRIGAVQEGVAAKGYYKCDDVLVVTNRRFTEPARKLARANAVTLWSRDELAAKLLAAGGARATAADTATPAAAVGTSASVAPTAAATSTPANASEPTPAEASSETGPAHCVTCDAAVSAKVRDYCLARPARFGGRVYCYRYQRSAPTLA